MRKIAFLSLVYINGLAIFGQAGKYFPIVQGKCKNSKVFIDYRIQQYCSTEFTADWTGGCKNGYADGNGKLTIRSQKANRSFNMTYEGTLVMGKKEGKGNQKLFLWERDGSPVWLAPYYSYDGFFKNDEFDGYGEFKADYPYPVDPDNAGKGISMENLALGSSIWRSDLFFYQYNGLFKSGKIADTDNGTGRTKKMRLIGKEVEYKGPIHDGMPNGKGTAIEVTIMAVAKGQSYSSASGNFVNGKLNGFGKEISTMSDYEGEFVNGIRDGKGKITFYELDYKNEDGRAVSQVIDGSFHNGQANGFCTVYYQKSAAYKYTGPIKDGELEGTGEIEFLNGSKLRGNFHSGKMEGEGAISFANGDKFSGIYADDKPLKGTLYYANGSKYVGGMSVREEKDKITGKPVQTYIRQGKGTMTDKDGRTYAVNCENGNCNETN